MPTFNELVDLSDWVDIEVSVEDFYEEMDSSEKKEMASLLTKAGYIEADPSPGRSSWEFDEAINKIRLNYYSLSNEDIAPIIQLAKRF
jgi:hypothetical protein